MDCASRASALVVTRGSRAPRCEIQTWWEQHGSGGPIFWVDFSITALRRFGSQERVELPGSVPSPLLAFCALGHPEAFYADLLVAGLPWVATRSFKDHRGLSPSDLRTLDANARSEEALGLVCTEKDAVKFQKEHGLATTLPLWIAEQRVVGAEPLMAYVLDCLKAAAEKIHIETLSEIEPVTAMSRH
jgi:tetraacyldisaccharide 4'-kinase